MSVNYLAVCEFYESKPALYYDDSHYHIDKIGSFVTNDFDISFGVWGSTNSGSVSTPQSASFSQPLKVGDIVNVTLVNYNDSSKIKSRRFTTNAKSEEEDKNSPTYKPGWTETVTVNGNRLQRCFVISAIDGQRLVLKDFVEYNLSYCNVGYAGSVNNETTANILAILSDRELRAFPVKMYRDINLEDKEFRHQFATGSGFVSWSTATFLDDFERTNTTPYDILIKALQNATFQSRIGEWMHVGKLISVGAVVQKDEQGFYVLQYIDVVRSRETISIRIKPSANINVTPLENTHATSIWIQPDENADDYVRAGVIIQSFKADNSSTLKMIDQVTEAEYTGYGITHMPSLNFNYNSLFETNKVLQADSNAFEGMDSSKINEAKDRFKEAMKKYIGRPLTPQQAKRIVYAVTHNENVKNPSNPDEVKFEEVIKENVTDILKKQLAKAYTPLELELAETDFYNTNFVIDGDEKLQVWYSPRLGGGINGEWARCSSIRYTSKSRSFKLETTAFYEYPRIQAESD